MSLKPEANLSYSLVGFGRARYGHQTTLPGKDAFIRTKGIQMYHHRHCGQNLADKSKRVCAPIREIDDIEIDDI